MEGLSSQGHVILHFAKRAKRRAAGARRRAHSRVWGWQSPPGWASRWEGDGEGDGQGDGEGAARWRMGGRYLACGGEAGAQGGTSLVPGREGRLSPDGRWTPDVPSLISAVERHRLCDDSVRRLRPDRILADSRPTADTRQVLVLRTARRVHTRALSPRTRRDQPGSVAVSHRRARSSTPSA